MSLLLSKMLLFVICMCVWYVYMWVCVFTCVDAHLCADTLSVHRSHMHVWMQVEPWSWLYFPQWLSTLHMEVGSLMWAQDVPVLDNLASQPVCATILFLLPVLRLQMGAHAYLMLTWILGVWTAVSMLSQQAFHLMSHLWCPMLFLTSWVFVPCIHGLILTLSESLEMCQSFYFCHRELASY